MNAVLCIIEHDYSFDRVVLIKFVYMCFYFQLFKLSEDDEVWDEISFVLLYGFIKQSSTHESVQLQHE